MDRVDRLITRAKPKPTIFDKLKQDNPFWGKSFDELLDCMCPHIPTELEVPESGTMEIAKFNYALIEALHKKRSGGNENDKDQT